MIFTDYFNTVLGVLTIVSQILALMILLVLIFPKVTFVFSGLVRLISKNALWISFLILLGAMLGSLVYSDILGYEPCKLCWFQRIFIYSQVVILGIGAWRKENTVALYAIVLSSIGGLIALYQYLAQFGWNPLGLSCLASNIGACSKIFVNEFGYVTIPLMSLSVLILTLLILILPSKIKEII